jgi:PTH1 family peptidyl-tRNA hydrolase
MAIELVVGLGNPGRRYADTRHNVGFRVADELARRHGEGSWVKRDLVHLVSTSVAPRLLLAKPMTYMNRSADAVQWLLEWIGVELKQMLIVVDDVDLSFGSLRIRRSGGPGTHNGLRSIVTRVGTGFPRLRVGVRGEAVGDDLADYVLSPFENPEGERLPSIIGRAADAVEAAAHAGVDTAMNRFNRTPPE